MYALVFLSVFIDDVSRTLQHLKLLHVSQDKSQHKPRFLVTHRQGSAGQVDLSLPTKIIGKPSLLDCPLLPVGPGTRERAGA